MLISLWFGGFSLPSSGSPSGEGTSRRARAFLYVLGAFFLFLGLSLLLIPAFAASTAHWGGVICTLIGAGFLAVAKFGSERWVHRFETLLTGWP